MVRRVVTVRVAHSSWPACLTDAAVLAVKLITAITTILSIRDTCIGIGCKAKEKSEGRNDGEPHDRYSGDEAKDM